MLCETVDVLVAGEKLDAVRQVAPAEGAWFRLRFTRPAAAQQPRDLRLRAGPHGRFERRGQLFALPLVARVFEDETEECVHAFGQAGLLVTVEILAVENIERVLGADDPEAQRVQFVALSGLHVEAREALRGRENIGDRQLRHRVDILPQTVGALAVVRQFHEFFERGDGLWGAEFFLGSEHDQPFARMAVGEAADARLELRPALAGGGLQPLPPLRRQLARHAEHRVHRLRVTAERDEQMRAHPRVFQRGELLSYPGLQLHLLAVATEERHRLLDHLRLGIVGVRAVGIANPAGEPLAGVAARGRGIVEEGRV